VPLTQDAKLLRVLGVNHGFTINRTYDDSSFISLLYTTKYKLPKCESVLLFDSDPHDFTVHFFLNLYHKNIHRIPSFLHYIISFLQASVHLKSKVFLAPEFSQEYLFIHIKIA